MCDTKVCSALKAFSIEFHLHRTINTSFVTESDIGVHCPGIVLHSVTAS